MNFAVIRLATQNPVSGALFILLGLRGAPNTCWGISEKVRREKTNYHCHICQLCIVAAHTVWC